MCGRSDNTVSLVWGTESVCVVLLYKHMKYEKTVDPTLYFKSVDPGVWGLELTSFGN